MTGPESAVKLMIKGNNTAFFPIMKSIELESKEQGDKSQDREVRVKDMDDFKTNLKYLIASSEGIKKGDQQFQSELKDLRENVMASAGRVQILQQSLSQEDDGDKKKKKKKGA